jgi:hypothetical protein
VARQIRLPQGEGSPYSWNPDGEMQSSVVSMARKDIKSEMFQMINASVAIDPSA